MSILNPYTRYLEGLTLWHYHAENEIEHEHVALDVFKASGESEQLLAIVTPVVNTLLLAVLVKVNVQLAIERKSLRGVVGWCKLAKQFIKII